MASARRMDVAIVVLCALLAGCATSVKVRAVDPALGGRLAEAPLVAVGGVTVAPELGAGLAPQDAADAAAAVQRAFLAERPELEVWPLALVEERRGAEPLAAVADQYGRLGRLLADQLLPLADDLDPCRLLALVRVTGDDVRSLSQQPGQPAAATGTGRDEPGASPWITTVSTERTVRVTIDLFDLVAGRSVWQAEARSRVRERYRYEDRLQRDPGRYLQERLAADAEAPTLDRRGEFLHLPDLVDLIGLATSAALEKLPAARR